MARHQDAVAPEIADVGSMTACVHWSRNARINEIFRGMVSGAFATRGVRDVGVWPVGPACPRELLAVAAASGNKPRHRGVGQWAKMRFLKGQFNWSSRFLGEDDCDLLLIWNGVKGHRRVFADAALRLGKPVLYFEEGPLPGRITADFVGVNYGGSLPRRIDFYEAWAKEAGADLGAWRRLGASMQPRAAARADVAQVAASEDLSRDKFIFCPLQVPGDSQITIFGDWIRSVEQMIDVLAEASQSLPQGWHLRIKEHPSARKSFGEKLDALSSDKFRVDNSTNTFEQVAASQAVLNINSSVGLQAFFFDKPVIVLGHAFYAFDGLATKVSSASELASTLAAPDALSFDSHARDVFMSYLDQEYFPEEDAVKSGRCTLADVIARDKRRDAVLAGLS